MFGDLGGSHLAIFRLHRIRQGLGRQFGFHREGPIGYRDTITRRTNERVAVSNPDMHRYVSRRQVRRPRKLQDVSLAYHLQELLHTFCDAGSQEFQPYSAAQLTYLRQPYRGGIRNVRKLATVLKGIETKNSYLGILGGENKLIRCVFASPIL
ncbi:MAG: hypothetical protein WB567_18815, partial [Terracidiphilus sp.]